MSEGFRKIWMYLVPLLLLGIVATCDWDFSVKNPFANKNKATEALDSTNLDDLDSTVSMTVHQPTDSFNAMREPDKSQMEVETKPNNSTDRERIKKWRLVVGSLQDRPRAENLASRIQNPQKEILYVGYLDTYRVVYESYDDLHLAQQGFTEVSGRFPQAWLVYY